MVTYTPSCLLESVKQIFSVDGNESDTESPMKSNAISDEIQRIRHEKLGLPCQRIRTVRLDHELHYLTLMLVSKVVFEMVRRFVYPPVITRTRPVL